MKVGDQTHDWLVYLFVHVLVCLFIFLFLAKAEFVVVLQCSFLFLFILSLPPVSTGDVG